MNMSMCKNLKDYFPSIARDAVEYEECGPWELRVIVSSGASYSYDDMHKTIRRLPRDRNNMTEDEFRNEFGIRLRKYIERKHISQAELSDRTGISEVCISKYINGTRTPSFYMADKIARALDCSTEEFRY